MTKKGDQGPTAHRPVSVKTLLLLLAGILTISSGIIPVHATETIYIRADGSIDPPTAPILTLDSITYTLTGNVDASIVVEKDNIILDGADYTVQGVPGGESRGIDITERSNVTIRNVKITGFGCGICAWVGAFGDSLYNNNVTGNGYVGIAFNGSNSSIFGNNIMNNGFNGIDLEGSSLYPPLHNRIFGNNLTGNGRSGIIVQARNNTIWGNNIAHNEIGIDFLASTYNTIFGNNITYNKGAGISFYSSSYNSIYRNNFIQNTVSLWGPSPVNTWDGGYPSGGNYWTAYSGVDERRGPNQDQPGSDGMGDTPYIFDSNNQDRYPLMSSLGVGPPTTIDDYDGLWRTADFAITLGAFGSLSGVAETYYRINDGATESTGANGRPLIFTEGSNNKLEYWSVDRAGNEETPHKILTGVKLDKTPPAGSIAMNDGAIYTNSTGLVLTLTASDATSGVSQMRFSPDAITWTDWTEYAPTRPWTIGQYSSWKVYVQFRDVAGLVSQYEDSIVLDLKSPRVNAWLDQVVGEGTTVTFDGAGSDDESGISSYTWTFTDGAVGTLNGINPSYTFNNPGIYVVILTVADPAGNTATDTMTVTVLETTKPVANAGPHRTVSTGTEVVFNAEGSTDNVGVVSYEWDFGDGTTSTGIRPTHFYTTPGTYTVTLTVRDAADNTDTHTITVTVRPRGFFATPWLEGPVALWIIGIAIAGLLTTFSAAILWKKAKAIPRPTHRKVLEEAGQTRETREPSRRVRLSVPRPRTVAGIVLTILGWTAAGYSIYLTAILLHVAIARINVGTAIIVLAIVGVISIIAMGVGWLFSGLGAVLLRRKLPLLAPIVNTALFGSLFIVAQLL